MIQHEYFDMTRVIHMNETDRPSADAPHTKSGYSIGRWEGDPSYGDS